MIRVIIADDHAIVRQGIRKLLESEPGMTVVAEVGDGSQVVDAIRQNSCDVLVLDLSFPTRSGIELVRELRDVTPRVNIVIFSMYPEDQLSLNLFHEGALAYLNKERDPSELFTAIRRAADGRRYITDTLSDLSLEVGHKVQQLPHHQLTAREHQVFVLIIQGRTVSEIAGELELSSSTVSNHVAAIRSKLGAGSTGDIVRYASRIGLV